MFLILTLLSFCSKSRAATESQKTIAHGEKSESFAEFLDDSVDEKNARVDDADDDDGHGVMTEEQEEEDNDIDENDLEAATDRERRHPGEDDVQIKKKPGGKKNKRAAIKPKGSSSTALVSADIEKAVEKEESVSVAAVPEETSSTLSATTAASQSFIGALKLCKDLYCVRNAHEIPPEKGQVRPHLFLSIILHVSYVEYTLYFKFEILFLQLNFPHAIIIGWQKTATTSLFVYLNK